MQRVCKICSKVFDVWPSYVARGGGICCSVICQRILHSQYMKSLPSEKSPHWKGGLVTRDCFKCGKAVHVKPHKKDKRVFCSKSCSSSITVTERTKTGIILKCKLCKAEHYVIQSAINRGEGLYCSMRCRAIDNVLHQRKRDTDIELLLEQWLISNNILFEKQKSVKGITLVDFFIRPNICVFADGDYWHSIPARKSLDVKQTSQLEELGFVVYRLKGSDIKLGARPPIAEPTLLN